MSAPKRLLSTGIAAYATFLTRGTGSQEVLEAYSTLVRSGALLHAYTLFKIATEVFLPHLKNLYTTGKIVRLRDIEEVRR